MRIRIRHIWSMRIWIRSELRGLMTEIGKLLQVKKIIYIFIKKFNALIPRADVQATGEVLILQKRTSSSSKFEISSLLWVSFALLDPDPADQYECGSGSGSTPLSLIKLPELSATARYA
jgi:hypothetical protein